METRLARLETVVVELRSNVLDLERRLAAVERAALAAPPAGPAREGLPAPASTVPAVAVPAGTDLVSVLSFAGRSLIVLGGAFLLRAITEAGLVPALAGALLALAYATVWIAAAGRAAGKGRPVDAGFHGFTGAIVGYPLIYEATVGFRFFSPGISAAALAAFTGLALFVSWHRAQRTLAWIATIGSLATAVTLVPATDAPVPYTLFLIALGTATLWLGYVRDWTILRWPAALVADVVAVGLVGRALAVPPRDAPGLVVGVLLLLVVAYLASTAVRTLLRGRNVVPFEVVQTALALCVGVGGSMWILREAPTGRPAFGALVAIVGALSYAVAFAFVDRRQGRGRNFYFYTSLSVLFTLVGAGLLVGLQGMSWVAVGLAIVNAALAVRFGRVVLNLHAVVYLLVGAWAAGTLADTGAAVSGLAGAMPPGATMTALVTTAAALVGVLCSVAGAPDASASAGWTRVPRASMLAVLLWVGGGSLIAMLARQITDAGAPEAAGTIATIRTVVFALAALALAMVGRGTRVREAVWFVYPLLLATGLKILLVDLRASTPSRLVVALATYGAALILAPRVLRRRA